MTTQDKSKAVAEARAGELRDPSLRSGEAQSADLELRSRDLLPHEFTHPKKDAFLVAFGELGTVTRACEAAGIHRRTAYDWQESDPDFTGALELAKAEFADRVEARMFDYLATANHPNPLLQMFTLKALRPDKYRDEVTVNQNVRALVITVSRDESTSSPTASSG